MKIKVLLLFAIMFSYHSFAQEWFTNLDKASECAEQNNHNIVLVFQGSDWCGPCIKLEKEVWSTPEFKKLSKDHFVMLKADFPRKKENKPTKEVAEQNAKLAEKYNPEGYFPLVVVLNKEGKILGKMGYEKCTPQAYFDKLKTLEQSL